MISAKLSLSASVRSVILQTIQYSPPKDLDPVSPEYVPVSRQDHGLIGPGGPVGHQAEPVTVLNNDSLLLGNLLLCIV